MPLTLHDITCDDAYRGVLSALLRDRSQPNSTGSIIWATGAYANHGVGYAGSDMMTVETVRHLVSIGELVPRCEKDADTQRRRTADKAEVFTPSWLCNDMINGIEECEFGAGARPFNDESDGPRGWKATVGSISFPDGGATGGAGSGKRLVPAKPRWYRYIGLRCLEITCGEAPYLTSRYDAVTNEPIPQAERIGFLDRKIRVAVENTPAGSAERKKAIDRALSSVYGFEYQGDNLFLARMNILLTWHEAAYGTADGEGDAPTTAGRREDRWDEIDALAEAANTISRNIVQMDGITLTVPRREQGGEEPAIETGGSLFGQWGGTGEDTEPGNADNYVEDAHDSTDGMPVYACIYNRGNKRVTFRDMLDGRGRKTMAFDFVIGNPPYHKDGGGRKKIPIYGKFMESFSDPKIAKHATFVTPDGFVKGGRMLEPLRRSLVDNDHLSRVTFHRDKVFKQAVNAAITTFDNTTKHDYVDKNIVNEDGSVEKSTLDWKYRSVIVNEDKEQIQVLFENKVAAKSNNMSILVTNGSYFGLKTACFRSYEYKFMDCPDNRHFMKMLVGAAKKGKNKKDFYWVCPEDTFQRNEGNIKSESIHLRDSDKWKVAFTEAGTVDKTPAKTWILGNGVIYTGKYLGILVHDKRQAINANKYFTTNFYRAGIASKMTGWDKFASWHSLVPIQDFSNDSDIDWSGSLKSIDEQLYRKYGFTDEDIATIDRFITPAPGYSDPFAYADPRIERNDFASPSLYTVSDTLGDTADGGSVIGSCGADSADDAGGAGGSVVGEADVPSGGDSDEDVSVDGDVDIADGGECVE